MKGDSPQFTMPHYCSDYDRGEVINGGFGLVLDGTEEAAERLKMMLSWDVLNGVRFANSTEFNIIVFLSRFSFLVAVGLATL